MRQTIHSPNQLSFHSSLYNDNHEITPVKSSFTHRGRQMFKETKFFYQDITMSKNSTCETKLIAPRNMKTRNHPNDKKRKEHSRNIKSPLDDTKSPSSLNSSREWLKKQLYKDDIIDISNQKEYEYVSNEAEKSIDMQSMIMETMLHDIDVLLDNLYNRKISTKENNNTRLNPLKKDLFFNPDKHEQALILQIVANRIKQYIQKYKEEIYQIPYFNQISHRILYEKREMISLSSLNLALSLSKSINTSKCITQMQDQIFDYSFAKILLKKLIYFREIIKKASINVENIFCYPLCTIVKTAKTTFDIEKMHIEEFSRVVLNDKLISNLLIEFRKIFNTLKIKEEIDLIDLIEQDKTIKTNEFMRFDRALKNILNSYIIEEEEILKSKNKTFQTLSPSTVESLEARENDDIVDIDELIKFIDSEDNDKKQKKKRNKKYKKPQTDIVKNDNNMINKKITFVDQDINDAEIEQFKFDIINTKDSFLCQKIKPIISQQWVNNLINTSINNSNINMY